MSCQVNKHLYTLDQSKFKQIKSWPFIYWISDEFRAKFGSESIEKVIKVCSGLSTANNNSIFEILVGKFRKKNYFSEDCPEHKKNGLSIGKGGQYNKWYGNVWLSVNWGNNGKSLKQNGGTLRNKGFYFKEGITCSGRSSAKGVSYRILPEGHIFDVGATGLIPVNNNNVYYALGFMNSKIIMYIINCLNPTVNTSEGDLKQLSENLNFIRI